MKVLIFIPARGGSKGIPGKNLTKLNGEPLIKYTLDTVKELVKNNNNWIPFISTDNNEILTYCMSEGFKMDYLRPEKLSKDNSPMIDAILDALDWLSKNNQSVDSVLLLQPTSPLRDINSLLEAIALAKGKKDFSIVSTTNMREHPCECIEINKDGWSYLSKPESSSQQRQSYDSNYYFMDGSFYFASKNFLMKNKTFLKENKTEFFNLSHYWPIDIDEYEDLVVASAIMKEKNV